MTEVRPPRIRSLLMLGALLIGACGAAGEAPWTYAPLGPTPPPATPAQPTPANGSPAPGNVIELELTGRLEILQAGQPVSEINVMAGETYTFRIDNTAGFDHNFYLGPPDRLAANDVAGLPGLDTWQSGVREFDWTADDEALGWEFACTVPGHYQSMHGQLIFDE